MKQIDIYRKVTGEQRLEQSFQLSEMVRDLAKANIKSEYPYLSNKGIMKKLKERMYNK